MSAGLRRYAYAQARTRARLSRRLRRSQLDTLIATADESALARELAARDGSGRGGPSLEALERAAAMLTDGPRRVVTAYRDRYTCENLKVLLRAVDAAVPYAEIAPLLHPVAELGPGAAAEELLRAASVADAVELLAARPFGAALRRALRGAGAEGLGRLGLELLAERECYEAIWRALEALDREDRTSAIRVLGVKLDCVNLLRARRLREFHGLPAEQVLAFAIRGGRRLAARERAVLAHEPLESWPALLATTPYAAALAAADSMQSLERELGRVLARAARRELSGPPFQLGLILAYLVLVELEAADVARVSAARRYRRSEDWIRSGLVLEYAT